MSPHVRDLFFIAIRCCIFPIWCATLLDRDQLPDLEIGGYIYGHCLFLNHLDKVDEYLWRQETDFDALQEKMKANPEYHATMAKLRERIQATISELIRDVD